MVEKEAQEETFIEGNIPLIINTYVDIFSSFDSRAFNEKALSDDFLSEVKRAARDKGDFGLELVISVPHQKRVISDETKIRKRLKEHFHKHYLEKEKELKKIKKLGLSWVILGALINILVAFGFISVTSNILHTLLGLFEVPSWFLIWEGLGKIFLESKKIEPDSEFYRKMKDCKVTFKSY